MSDIEDKLGRQPEIVFETPGTRAKIEAALNNPDLKRLVALLIENQNDPAFLQRVRNFIEADLKKES